MNLILHKALDGQVALDFKAKSKPVGHLVSPHMKVKLWVSYSSLARFITLINE